jgi:GTP-binding protein
VFTKADLLPEEDAREKAEEVVRELNWEAPWMLVSSVTRKGTDELMQGVSDKLELIEDEEAVRLEAGELSEKSNQDSPGEEA